MISSSSARAPCGIALAAEAFCVWHRPIEHQRDRGRGGASAHFAEAEHPTRIFDRVILVLGGTTPTNFLHTLGIAFNADGPVFDEAGATNVAGPYLIGDLVVGKKGGSIITAFNSAVRALKSICAHDLPCKKPHLE